MPPPFRARNEQEFERIHQEQQKAVKPKNARKAHRAKVLAAASQASEPATTPKPPPKRASKATKSKPPAAPQQTSWVQVQAVEEVSYIQFPLCSNLICYHQTHLNLLYIESILRKPYRNNLGKAGG